MYSLRSRFSTTGKCHVPDSKVCSLKFVHRNLPSKFLLKFLPPNSFSLSLGWKLSEDNRNMSKSKGWTLQSSLLTLWIMRSTGEVCWKY